MGEVMGHKRSILVVDDHEEIRELLKLILEQKGYRVRGARDAEVALRKTKERRFDLVLIDIMMPGKDGLHLCHELRKQLGNEVYLVFLTARVDEKSEVSAFDAGADDYITKPIKTKALAGRIEALLRRKEQKQKVVRENLQRGDLFLDPCKHVVKRGEQELVFRHLEFEILYFLVSQNEAFVSRDTLLEKIWDEETYVSKRTIDVHIRRIRKQLGESCIVTKKGVGYAFRN